MVPAFAGQPAVRRGKGRAAPSPQQRQSAGPWLSRYRSLRPLHPGRFPLPPSPPLFATRQGCRTRLQPQPQLEEGTMVELHDELGELLIIVAVSFARAARSGPFDDLPTIGDRRRMPIEDTGLAAASQLTIHREGEIARGSI